MNLFQNIAAKLLRITPAQELTTHTISELVRRAYEAAQPNKQFKKIPQALSPNAATMTATEKMRAQARYLDENHDLSISVLDTLVGKIIGKGISITPMVKRLNGDLDEYVNDQIRKIWKRFEERPEITRSHNMGSADRLTCRTWLRDGEALNRILVGPLDIFGHNSGVPMGVELIEADYMPFLKNEDYGETKVIQGVEIHRYGFPVRYHILKQSPYEIYPGAVAGLGIETFTIPAEQMCHIKFVRRMAQVRGVTIFHGVIRRLENIKDYEESEQIAARVAAALTGYIKKDIEMGTGTETQANRDFEMHPGMIFDLLAPGEDIGTISSDRPNTSLLEYRNAMLRAVCSGTMSNFSAVSQYYMGTYSSQRQELVESKCNYDILRDVYVSMIKKPTYMTFINLGLNFGMIDTLGDTDLETMYNVEVNGTAVPWIDPKKEMEAFKIAKDEKFIPRAGIIRMIGLDPTETMTEIDKEEEMYPVAVNPAPTTNGTEESDNEGGTDGDD